MPATRLGATTALLAAIAVCAGGSRPAPRAEGSAGTPTATLVAICECPADAWDDAFGASKAGRVMTLGAGPFTAGSARAALARLAGVDSTDVAVAMGWISFIDDASAEAWTTEGGDGFAFSNAGRQDSVLTTVRPLQHHDPAGRTETYSIRSGEALALPLTLDGRTCVAVLSPRSYEPTRPASRDPEFIREKRGFGASIMELGTGEPRLGAATVPDSLDQLLTGD